MRLHINSATVQQMFWMLPPPTAGDLQPQRPHSRGFRAAGKGL